MNTGCYSRDAQTQQDLKNSGKSLEEALSDFTQATHASLLALNKTPVVWEGQHLLVSSLVLLIKRGVEMVLEHQVSLSNNTIVMLVSGDWMGYNC